MKKLVFLAPIVLLSFSMVLAQSSTSNTQSNSGTQATSPTPPGDTRDSSGNTIAPDGSKTPKGSNTFGSKTDNSQPNSSQPSSMSSPQSTQSAPPGDRRDRFGNTIAPDGTDTPRGTNTFGKKDDNSTVPANGTSTPSSQKTSATPTGDRRDRYGDTVAPDGSTTPAGANTNSSQGNTQSAPNSK